MMTMTSSNSSEAHHLSYYMREADEIDCCV
jgi:hypothetical protein